MLPWLALLGAACSHPAPSTGPLHLVLVTLDTLRADRLGCYGCERGLTPHLDALAARGVRFDDAIAQSISTPPSHASILTGLIPARHGLRRLWGGRLAQENTTLAEVLAGEGFTCAAFVGALPLRAEVGLDQGFEHYDAGILPGAHERVAQATNERVAAWIASRPSGRLFLWVHYFDPHTPYFPPAAYRERHGAASLTDPAQLLPIVNGNAPGADVSVMRGPAVERMRALYDAEVSYTDDAVGALFDLLEDAGILDDAVIGVIADHGELLGEHDYWFGHWDVFDETARVPMILARPDGKWSGLEVESTVASVDLMPTLLHWLGVDNGLALDGRDLTGILDGEPPGERGIYTEQLEYFPVRALRASDWFLLERGRPTGIERTLFRRAGPGAPLVASADPAVEERLARRIDELGRGAGPAVQQAREDEGVAAGLRALGYTDGSED